MANGRCRMHRGPSTGLARPKVWSSRKSGRKHGHYSSEAKQVRREARQQYRLLRQLIDAGDEDDVLDLISSM
jgi:hypothetical protein